MEKKTKQVLLGTGIAFASAAAIGSISHFITKILVNGAIDREPPKAMTKARSHIGGSSYTDELLEKSGEMEKDLLNNKFEEIKIKSKLDGVELAGHFWHCENARRIIVAMHGWRSSWHKDFSGIAQFWHNNRCSILFADQRGQGNSGGDFMGFGLLERYDCLDWVNWLIEKGYNEVPIYLAGVSMGAATVLMTAGFDLPDNVCGIMADCGFTSPHEIWKHVVKDNLHLHYGLRGNIANDMCKGKIDVGIMDYSCIDAMKNSKTPILFIHGTDDKFVPIKMTYENYKACASPKRLLVVPGAEHAFSFYVDKESYEKAEKSFWQEFDK